MTSRARPAEFIALPSREFEKLDDILSSFTVVTKQIYKLKSVDDESTQILLEEPAEESCSSKVSEETFVDHADTVSEIIFSELDRGHHVVPSGKNHGQNVRILEATDTIINTEQKRRMTLKALVDLGEWRKRVSLFPGNSEITNDDCSSPVFVNHIDQAGINVQRVTLFGPEILDGVNLLPGSPTVAQLHQGTQRRRLPLVWDFFNINSIWSIGSHISMFLFICTAVYLSFTDKPPALLLFPVIVSIISYILILVECNNSNVLAIIHDMTDIEEACKYIEQLRRTKPHMAVEILPFRFHTEPKPEEEAEFIRNCMKCKDLKDIAEISQLKKENRFVNYTSLVDASGNLKDYLGSQITKVTINSIFGFLNTKSQLLYDKEKKRLIRLKEDDDMYALCTESMFVPSVEECIFVHNDLDLGLRVFVSKTAFWIASVLCLTWPYRIWLAGKTRFVSFTIVKLLAYDNRSVDSPLKPFSMDVNNA